ncbi:CoA transferase [Actinospica sp. MGRD01-02]|uniref:CoA transferase n=2 Tax=Actinospica acidithermotolerans TaxID=2828514 RepID=A0A941EDF9_9ACTN|nr:CoA transferase [Actinospica acidithermotolerans]
MLAEVRGVGEPAGWVVDARRVAASFRGDQLLRRDGVKFPSFAPLSGFFRTNDGWVRTHANYDHHRARLIGALGLDASADRAALATRLEQLGAIEAEELVRANGGIAAAVRTPDEWRAHPQSAAAAELPLVAIERLAAADVREREDLRVRGFGLTAPVDALRPAAGLRVLDLTRVIAGPVATRTLALLGADVLRIDSPQMPEIAAQHLDNGMGKRSALLDLRDQKQHTVFERLLDSADVVVTGYRPHALDAFGLDAATLAARRPGLVVATLDAWGSVGPWGGRRGFDSIVQAASGISVLEATDGAAGAPGALPAQALDHATGYLLAAGVLQAVRQQTVQGGSRHVHAHLARTAHALIANSSPDGNSQQATNTALDFDACLAEQATHEGILRYARPALASVTRAVDYPSAGGTWGADEPAWT